MERLGAGREAEVFAWGPGRVVRVVHDPELLAREAAALRAARAAGAPAPEPFEQVEVDGRPGLVMERCDGEDLLAAIGRRPWRVWSIGRRLGRLHAELHQVEAPPSLPVLRDELRPLLGSPLVPDDVRADAGRQLDALPDGDRLCHGDLHPGNVLGDKVIDWTNATRGAAEADVARTCLLIDVAKPPGGRLPPLARVGRRVLRAAYASAYRAERGDVDPGPWLPVLAAARLAEDVDGERDELLRRAWRGPPKLDAAQRRWLWLNAGLITAAVNLVLNAGIAWATAAGEDPIPVWATPLTGGPSTIADTAGTLFLLPFITCLIVTTVVRRDLRAGRLRRRGGIRLPRDVLARAALIGAACAIVLTPRAVLPLVALGELSLEAFVAYKAILAVVYGAIVTPLIALAAMGDQP
jgi:thiamine kinase